MNYAQKKVGDGKEEFFYYSPKRKKIKNNQKKYNENNPFIKLSELRFR